jgi:hypothetical protein
MADDAGKNYTFCSDASLWNQSNALLLKTQISHHATQWLKLKVMYLVRYCHKFLTESDRAPVQEHVAYGHRDLEEQEVLNLLLWNLAEGNYYLVLHSTSFSVLH